MNALPAVTTPDDLLAQLAHGEGILPPTLLLLAHPADETASAASVLARLGPQGYLVYVTNGNPRGEASDSHLEVRDALGLARVGSHRVHCLGYGRRQAVLELIDLVLWLADWISFERPAMLLTHPYEGSDPDHDACAFSAQAACALLAESHVEPPARMEFACYQNTGSGLVAGAFLPGDQMSAGRPTRMAERLLSAAEQQEKMLLRACYGSQRARLEAFSLARERFRLAPDYDFAQPPHAGVLHYEQESSGDLTGARWRDLAQTADEALRELSRARGVAPSA
jgi:LmbE family N-acetylglucosaminyl deacetylase